MRALGFCILLLNLLMLSSPAAAEKCKKMAEEPPADRPRVSLLHWPEVVIHSHVSIITDATQPDGTGTAKLYGPISHSKEVENFYIALFRDRGWKFAPEYQPANQYIFIRKNRRLSLTSEADTCMGYLLTLHTISFDPEKYKPEKPFLIEIKERLEDKLPKVPEKKPKGPELPDEIKKLPHNVEKMKKQEADDEAAKKETDKKQEPEKQNAAAADKKDAAPASVKIPAPSDKKE